MIRLRLLQQFVICVLFGLTAAGSAPAQEQRVELSSPVTTTTRTTFLRIPPAHGGSCTNRAVRSSWKRCKLR